MSATEGSQAGFERVTRLLITVYAVVFIAAGLGFNPFGFTRAHVFVAPKVTLWLLSSVPLLILILIDMRSRGFDATRSDGVARRRIPAVIMAAWIAMIVVALVTAFHGASVAWTGYPSTPEGALFFVALLGGLSLVWFAVQRFPVLDRVVRVSVVVVAVVASLMAVPQVFDWRVDYTVTSGQTFGDPPRHTFVSVWPIQSPNAVYWHRGHLGIVACLGLLTAAGSLLRTRGALGRRAWASYAALLFMSMGVMVASTRAPQLAAGVGLLVLWASTGWMSWREASGVTARHAGVWALVTRQAVAVVVGLTIGGLLLQGGGEARAASLVGLVTGEASPKAVFSGTSGRTHYWRITLDAWLERPWFGSGFLAFHEVQADGMLERAVAAGDLAADEISFVQVTEFSVNVVKDDGSRWWRELWGSKPHNGVLELLLSVGIVGTVAVVVVYGLALLAFVRAREPLGVALLIAWFTHLLFWYESVQYSPLVWTLMGVLLARHTGLHRVHAR